MKVTNDKTEQRQAFLTIEIEPAELEESLDAAYKRLVKRVRVPGFRKGKAPRTVLENNIGKNSLLDDALEDMIPKMYRKAIDEQKVEAFGRPNIDIAQTDPVILKVVVPLKPTVKLGDYHTIKLQPEAVTIDEKDVDAAIEQLQHAHATWEPAEREIANNDLVVLDIVSTSEGKSFLDRKGVQYQVNKDLPYPAPGFSEQLIGAKPNEEKEFTLKFADDLPNTEFAGKDADYKVKVIEIKQEKLPELNDEFAKIVNPKFKDYADMRSQLTDDLKTNGEAKNMAEFEDKVLDEIGKISEIEFPPVLTEMEIDEMVHQQMHQYGMEKSTIEEFLQAIGKTDVELHDELKPVAEKRVFNSLILGETAASEKIKIEESETNAEIEKIVNGAKEENKEALQNYLKGEQPLASINNRLMTSKTIERLVAIAKGEYHPEEEKPVSTEEESSSEITSNEEKTEPVTTEEEEKQNES